MELRISEFKMDQAVMGLIYSQLSCNQHIVKMQPVTGLEPAWILG